MLAGLPAIKPRLATTDGASPTFTAEDVRAFIASQSLPSQVVGSSVTVEQVEFITNRDLRARFHEDTGGPDTRLLCVVTLRGQFAFPLPSVIQRKSGKTHATATLIRQVYDARTGNRLIEGLAR